MKPWTLMLAGLIAATPALAQEQSSPDASSGRPSAPKTVSQPTVAEAEAFIAKTEAESTRLSEYASRVAWLATIHITSDTDWLRAKTEAESNSRQQALAMEAATFDGVAVDPILRRKLEMLKRSVLLPVPDRAGASEDLADVGVRLRNRYSTGKVRHQDKELTLDDIVDRMRISRDPAELKALWEGWHAVAIPMKSDYASLVALANEGVGRLGFKDTGALWRSWYDMTPDQFGMTVDRLWSQIAPLYTNLQCYARARLNERYGDAVQPRTGPIRADLLGNMWAQDWGNVFDIMAPRDAKLGYDLTAALVKLRIRLREDGARRRAVLYLARFRAAAANVLAALDVHPTA